MKFSLPLHSLKIKISQKKKGENNKNDNKIRNSGIERKKNTVFTRLKT